MADELVDIYDSENESLGVSKLKSECHKDGSWHRAVHIWIYNKKGELLLQHRAKDKDLFPSKWDISVAGHISLGEEPIESAVREIQEEIGLVVDALEFVGIRKQNFVTDDLINNEYNYVYLLEVDVEDFKIQEEELQSVKFVKLDDVLEYDLVPHGEYWEDMISIIGERF